MRRYFFYFLTLCATYKVYGQASVLPDNVQIATAVLAAPSDKQAGAKVYGYAADGTFKIIRKGSNDFVCIADDPNKEGINVACYHADLDAFMERGRVLTKEGKSQKEIFDVREKEVKSKKLFMPSQPSTLYSLSGSIENYDNNTGSLKDGYLRYVVYIPFATAESTGLPLKPDVPGMPWIMDPGTHRAHIMINPAKK